VNSVFAPSKLVSEKREKWTSCRLLNDKKNRKSRENWYIPCKLWGEWRWMRFDWELGKKEESSNDEIEIELN
jgi:hypothetical protein